MKNSTLKVSYIDDHYLSKFISGYRNTFPPKTPKSFENSFHVQTACLKPPLVADRDG